MRSVDPSGHVTDAPLQHGVDGNYQALQVAIPYILAAAQDEYIRALALRIVANVKGHDIEGELDALYRFCRDAIKYRSDPRGQERVQSPRFTERIRTGDCLDKSELFCALAGSLGYVTRLVLLQVKEHKAGGFDHVYTQGKIPDAWKAYDPTPEEANAGWQADGIRKQYVSIYSPAEQLQLAGWLSKLVGIGGVALAPFTGGASLAISSAAGGLIGQAEAASAQEKQIGAAFEQQAAALASTFRDLSSKSSLTPQEYDQAAQGYTALSQFAEQYKGVKYVAQKWTSDAYGPQFSRTLDKLKTLVTTAAGATGAGASSGSSLSPLLIIGGGLAALYYFSSRGEA
jgi:hypothetical protein